jgi:hypothetical protein
MAQGYTQGAPCDLFREHIGLNQASFSATTLIDSSDFRETANIDGMPARNAHVHDTTAYPGTGPDADSWYERQRGGASPAQVSAGTGKLTRAGQLT